MTTDTLDQETQLDAADVSSETSQLSDDVSEISEPEPAPAPVSLIRKTTAPTKTEPVAVEQAIPAGFVSRTLGFALWPLVTTLAVVDVPFAGLGAGLKSIIGMIGIATSIIAAVTWGAILTVPHR